MLGQAAGFALLAAVSPTALLVMAVFLGSASPRTTAFLYVAGAVVMTVVMAIVVLVVLRAVGLNEPRQREPRYALRLGLGFLALLAAAFLTTRWRRPLAAGPAPGEDAAKKPGLIARLTTNPRPLAAFLVGLLLFAPSATFIAAVQVVATANPGVPLTVGTLVVIVILTVATVWAPLLAYLAAPEATSRTLAAANGWLRANGRVLLIGALWAAGVLLVVNGVLGV